jgi:hypothetical protein
MKRTSLFLVIIVGMVILGCGGESEQQPAQTVTVERTVEAPAPEDPAPASAGEDPLDDEAAEEPVDEPADAGPSAEKVRIPNVVGQDHQLAQDTLQSAGLYNLSEEDATGQGRALLFDRNWVIVSQSPKAGRRVSPDTTITLRSKKKGE